MLNEKGKDHHKRHWNKYGVAALFSVGVIGVMTISSIESSLSITNEATYSYYMMDSALARVFLFIARNGNRISGGSLHAYVVAGECQPRPKSGAVSSPAQRYRVQPVQPFVYFDFNTNSLSINTHNLETAPHTLPCSTN